MSSQMSNRPPPHSQHNVGVAHCRRRLHVVARRLHNGNGAPSRHTNRAEVAGWATDTPHPKHHWWEKAPFKSRPLCPADRRAAQFSAPGSLSGPANRNGTGGRPWLPADLHHKRKHTPHAVCGISQLQQHPPWNTGQLLALFAQKQSA